MTSNMFSIFATMSDTLIFAYLGLAVFSFEGTYDWGFIVVSVISDPRALMLACPCTFP